MAAAVGVTTWVLSILAGEFARSSTTRLMVTYPEKPRAFSALLGVLYGSGISIFFVFSISILAFEAWGIHLSVSQPVQASIRCVLFSVMGGVIATVLRKLRHGTAPRLDQPSTHIDEPSCPSLVHAVKVPAIHRKQSACKGGKEDWWKEVDVPDQRDSGRRFPK